MPYIIKDFRVNTLPLTPEPNSRYYVPNGQGTDLDLYITDINSNYRKINPIAIFSGVTSVGLSMPSAFNVLGSPITTSGTLTVTGNGTTSQYIRGDGSLAVFPSFTDTNFANIDLTLDADRVHDGAGFNLTLSDFGVILFDQADSATISSGNGTSNVEPFRVLGGNGGDTSDSSPILVSGGDAGNIDIFSGNGGSTTGTPVTGIGGAGGEINLTCGDGGTGTTFGGQGGNVTIAGGGGGLSPSGIPGVAGFASVKGGNAAVIGNSDGGDVFIVGGIPNGTGKAGDIYLGMSPSNQIRGRTIIGSTTGYDTAIFSVDSTTQGVVLPRMTTAQKNAISSPETGLIVFDTDEASYFQYNGSIWQNLYNAGSSGSVTSVGLIVPTAFTVSGSPVTTSGDITISGAGTTSQYIRGDATLANFLDGLNIGQENPLEKSFLMWDGNSIERRSAQSIETWISDWRKNNYQLSAATNTTYRDENKQTVTLATGENQIHGFVYYGDKLWATDFTSPMKLYRFNNLDDLTDYDTVVVSHTGSAGDFEFGYDLVYVPWKNKVYTGISDNNLTGYTYIYEIDPITLAVTELAEITTHSYIAPSAFAYDDTYLYFTMDNVIVKMELATYTYTEHVLSPTPSNLHSLRYDGTNLYATDVNTGRIWKVRPSDMTVLASTDVVPSSGITDDFCFVGDNLWAGVEGSSGSIHIIAKSDLSLVETISTGVSSQCYGTFFDGKYVWAVYNTSPGQIIRINPETKEIYKLTLATGENSPNEIVTDGQRLFINCFLSPSKVIRLTAPRLTYVSGQTPAGTVTSVGLVAPSAFNVSGSPVTSSGTLTLSGAGTTAQYIRGDGSLATFPTDTNLFTTDLTLTANRFHELGGFDFGLNNIGEFQFVAVDFITNTNNTQLISSVNFEILLQSGANFTIVDLPSASSLTSKKMVTWDSVTNEVEYTDLPSAPAITISYIDSSYTTGSTYGTLSGTLNSINTTFTVSQSAYISGKLKVFLNGQLLTQGTGADWTETTPASGTFDFVTAPEATDIITVEYVN